MKRRWKFPQLQQIVNKSKALHQVHTVCVCVCRAHKPLLKESIFCVVVCAPPAHSHIPSSIHNIIKSDISAKFIKVIARRFHHHFAAGPHLSMRQRDRALGRHTQCHWFYWNCTLFIAFTSRSLSPSPSREIVTNHHVWCQFYFIFFLYCLSMSISFFLFFLFIQLPCGLLFRNFNKFNGHAKVPLWIFEFLNFWICEFLYIRHFVHLTPKCVWQ